MAATSKWRQRYLNSQDGLGSLFPNAISNWSPPQEELVGWLRYYDAFYQRLEDQHYVAGREYVKAWMIEYDFIVDAFFVWFKKRSDEKQKEDRRDSGGRDHWAADVPRASDHGTVYKAGHQ